jgi:hypothetical protein
MEPIDRIDPKCPTAEAYGKALEAKLDAEGFHGRVYGLELARRYSEFAIQHVATCARCRSYRSNTSGPDDGRSPVWGGATLGLILGLIAGFFRENYWQTVLSGIVIGAVFGLAVNLLAAFGNRRGVR